MINDFFYAHNTLKKLNEKDLNKTAELFSCLKEEYGNLLIDGVLLEKVMHHDKYRNMAAAARALDNLFDIPQIPLPKVKNTLELVYRLSKDKESITKIGSPTRTRYIGRICSVVLGNGNYRRGALRLGLSSENLGSISGVGIRDIREPLYLAMGVREDLVKEFDLIAETYKTLIKNMALGYRGFQSLVRDDNTEHSRTSEFRDLCSKIFIKNEWVPLGLFDNEREQMFQNLSGIDMAHVVKATYPLGLFKRFIMSSVFGPKEDPRLRGLSPQEITYISDVVNDLLLEIPVKAEEIRNGVLHPSYGFTLIVKNTLEKDILENMGVPYNDQYTGACSTRTAGLLQLGEVLGTTPLLTNVHSRKNSLGVLEQEEVRRVYAPYQTITLKDLQMYQEVLDEKDIVILHGLYVQKLKQKEVAKDVGVSQGAISHRVSMAHTRIRLFEGIGGIPTDKELTNLCEYLCPADGTSETWAKHLIAIKLEKGNQTNAAIHLGFGQPHMSQFMRVAYKRTRELLGPIDDYKGAHIRAYKYLDMLVNYPYSTRTLNVKRHQGKADYLKKKAKKILSTK
jgi:hypothetical protein